MMASWQDMTFFLPDWDRDRLDPKHTLGSEAIRRGRAFVYLARADAPRLAWLGLGWYGRFFPRLRNG